MGDEGHPDHLLGDLLTFGRGPGHLDASAMAPSAGMDLRLDHHEVAAETASDVRCLCWRERDLAPRNWYAEPREN